MTDSDTAQAIETLAAEIGDNIYMDIAKWHLFLSNANLHTPLAEQLYPLVVNDNLTDAAVTNILRNTPVVIGGGRQELPLIDLIPQSVQSNLMNLLTDYQQTL